MELFFIMFAVLVWFHIHETHKRQTAERELERLRAYVRPPRIDDGIPIDAYDEHGKRIQ